MVYETMPVMLLDSLETIDADRIFALVEYVADYADYLVLPLARRCSRPRSGLLGVTEI